MSELIKDLSYYNSLFPNPDTPVSEQSITIKWSERKCYVYKYFITKLTATELDLINNYEGNADYELIGALGVYNPDIRIKILSQIERVERSDSSFEEIQLIIKENSAPNPLLSISNKFWIVVKDYLIEREYDEYPFNKKGKGMLNTVGRKGYETLNTNQLKYIHGLIDNDRNRPETDHFFYNDYLIQKGFNKDCNLIKERWASH
jgi:hypothetical protein